MPKGGAKGGDCAGRPTTQQYKTQQKEQPVTFSFQSTETEWQWWYFLDLKRHVAAIVIRLRRAVEGMWGNKDCYISWSQSGRFGCYSLLTNQPKTLLLQSIHPPTLPMPILVFHLS
ncbi:Uncharacterized protein TCM_040968 [Theobroma cacao]|uniref:Uncharacterized protein n=1 Tax=Theobroma cacao TaxID=3641 RepID=A0A061GSW7_THECC|nr:Uncharacterized protein TCM_040968 [Theobroma cacao]